MRKKIIQSLKDALANQRTIDEKADELILALEKSQDSISFFKKDKEMRIKYPDIWKMQLNIEEKNYDAQRSHLIEYGVRNQVDIETIFKANEDSRQQLEDLFKSAKS